MNSYDSRPDTHKHIVRVRQLLGGCVQNLLDRAKVHDDSKMESPEVEIFDRETPNLKALTYGSDEYKAALGRLGEGLKHHYQHNSHHPEFFSYNLEGELVKDEVADGTAITYMSLFDLLEMVVDWKAATERHNDGDIYKSITHNQTRFGMDEQLTSVIRNTVGELERMEMTRATTD